MQHSASDARAEKERLQKEQARRALEEEMAKMQKERGRETEKRIVAEESGAMLKKKEVFTERELRLVRNCITYAENDPAGTPGHSLMLIVAKMCHFFGVDPFAGHLGGQR